jgi:hypothetical protein
MVAERTGLDHAPDPRIDLDRRDRSGRVAAPPADRPDARRSLDAVAAVRRDAVLQRVALGAQLGTGRQLADLPDRQRPTRPFWRETQRQWPQARRPPCQGIVGPPARVKRVEGAKLFFPEEMPELIAAEARALWRASPR